MQELVAFFLSSMACSFVALLIGLPGHNMQALFLCVVAHCKQTEPAILSNMTDIKAIVLAINVPINVVKIADDLQHASCDRMALVSMFDAWLEAALPYANARVASMHFTLQARAQDAEVV